jgi:HAD superfamily hydrolase (TIGR01490 family)
MNGLHQYVAFFDLDKTLTGTNSGYALVRTAYDKKLLRKKDLLSPLLMLVLYKAGIRPADSIITALGEKLRGTDINEFEDLARQAVDDYLLRSLYPSAIDELSLHRNRNACTVILSSAVDGICNPVASHLSFDSVICTMMLKNNGILTGAPEGNYCYGREKSLRLTGFCNENGFDIKKAFYYADSYSDIEALQSVGNPVCINPDRRLRKHAERNGWEIRWWNKKAEGGRRKAEGAM